MQLGRGQMNLTVTLNHTQAEAYRIFLRAQIVQLEAEITRLDEQLTQYRQSLRHMETQVEPGATASAKPTAPKATPAIPKAALRDTIAGEKAFPAASGKRPRGRPKR